ncbi:MAG: sigma-54-dependent Fis family transcriptional regulator, partial [Desulfobulbaceae bacterium A2]
AVSAMKLGASDYIPKPYEPDDVLFRLRRALKEQDLERQCRRYRQERENAHERVQIISQHPGMLHLLEIARRVAQTDSTVLVIGETGVGKEMVVRKIHQWSPRSDFPLVAVNCGALAEGVMESELFGHEKGAFTGADARKIGFIEMADKGTLFLDEISTTDNRFQVKLLRVLQERVIHRVGSPSALAIDVRVIAASNQELEQEVLGNRFRGDLFYRLSVVTLRIPPLRERRTDIPLLADHFIEKYRHINPAVQGVSPAGLQQLLKYDYPGNVRELENIIERAMILASGSELTADNLLVRGSSTPAAFRQENGPAVTGATRPFDVSEAERRHILGVLAACQGRKMEAAKMLGVNKTTLWRKMKKYQLTSQDPESSAG